MSSLLSDMARDLISNYIHVNMCDDCARLIVYPVWKKTGKTKNKQGFEYVLICAAYAIVRMIELYAVLLPHQSSCQFVVSE